jgi:hypothetical protein
VGAVRRSILCAVVAFAAASVPATARATTPFTAIATTYMYFDLRVGRQLEGETAEAGDVLPAEA